ncbi:zinc finger SWIM domain-containing protein 8 homolog [Toxorhynchites rutilus septentrionalis]|uniref:zinc finger SWIM domain-containing protein 8 homolog n=1 Tax=Toxorhynchites rutilus septentrionalis TaxID=329112 RepID=UPI00247A8119|nr:zinc finger SWIM domain-containing protein 8 homolog [Toxorhynchites rutilus septentrionalis]
MVFSDVNYLTNSAPPAAAEWSSLLRPLRGREPEGMWNLLSIVREMYRRCDRNAVRLLEVITEEVMACDQILVWWFNIKLALLVGSNGHGGGKHSNTHSNSNATQHACSSLCDEIVVLWRLASLNPGLAPDERDMLHAQFTTWHLKILDRVAKNIVTSSSHSSRHQQNLRNDAELFAGFKPAIEACYLDWEDYPIEGITHTLDTNPMYHCPFTCFKQNSESKNESAPGQVNSSQAILQNNVKQFQQMPHHHFGHHHHHGHGHGVHHSTPIVASSSAFSMRMPGSSVITGGASAMGIGGVGVSNSGVTKSHHRREYRHRERCYGSSNSSSDSVPDRFAEAGVGSKKEKHLSVAGPSTNTGGNRSSVSSEGFCENDDDVNVVDDLQPSLSSKKDESVSDSSNSSSSSVEETAAKSNASAPSDSSEGNSILNDMNNYEISGNVKLYEVYNQIPPEGDSSSSFLSTVTTATRTNELNRLSANKQPVKVQKRNPVAKEEYPESDQDTRRPSKDESLSSSDSQQNVDDYNLYYYDAKQAQRQQEQQQQKQRQETRQPPQQVFSNLKRTEDAWDILFARAEGLHAHGHGWEACVLGVRLAKQMLANPPNLMLELPPPPNKKKGKKHNINPISHQLSVLASATLAKCAFLCTVLAENSEHYHLAFRVCLYGLEMSRPPASTKPLEVKLANQESDLLSLLKRIPLGHLELKIIRERAEALRDGNLKSRGEALLPIMLASFIFDALVMPSVTGRENRMKVMSQSFRMPTDENLGFEAAVAALGLKANVSEAEHPLLCEGTRRQRGDLALTLLSYYKDEPRKINRVMEKLLDREIHSLIKTPLLPSYYSNNPPTRSQTSQLRMDEYESNNQHLYAAGELQQPHHPGLSQNDFLVNSRPQSSTSAEMEMSMNALSLGQQQPMPTGPTPGPSNAQPILPGPPGNVAGSVSTTTTRSKDSRYKGKRAYPSIPNQPSEASSHFMFELAKNVLTKAGGTSSTSLFTQASTNQNHQGPHRGLHMCAFQLGLYALGLHNCVSPNWLSRTYSSHVSWIIGQAMDIGAPAISFLIDTWEGHLTPPEAAGMADRASSRGWDSNMVNPAAELALSVLPHAAALNPNEIQRAILQCKEQGDRMLERACLTVENAAKGGGVYPEVLFQVARYWYELYLRSTPGGEMEPNEQHDHFNVNIMSLIDSGEMQQQNQPPQPSNQSVVVSATPPQPYQQTITTLAPIGLAPYGPYSFPCQGIYHQNIPYHANQMQMYISTPPQFQYPPPPPHNNPPPQQPGGYQQPLGTSYQQMQTHPSVPPQGYNPTQYPQVPVQVQVPPPPPNQAQIQPNLYYGPQSVPMQQPPPQPQQPPPPPRPQPSHTYPPYAVPPSTPPVRPRHPHQFTSKQLRYLLAAFNAGMLALETLARRVHDDRPQAKYARNPPYGEDVKWLLRVSKRLGTQYLHQFCVCAVNSIVSPFVLHEVAIESAYYLSRHNPALLLQHLRSALAPLMQKCQQMYIQCIHQKLYHLTVSDYEECTSTIMSARNAFQITPEGSAQFKDWLQSIKRSKSCKKELWTQINAALNSK